MLKLIWFDFKNHWVIGSRGFTCFTFSAHGDCTSKLAACNKETFFDAGLDFALGCPESQPLQIKPMSQG